MSLNTKALFGRASDEWRTPKDLFQGLNIEFGFTLDPCTNPEGSNSKCKNFYTVLDDGLSKDWGTETVFVNPPYSKVSDWMAKCYESSRSGATVVALVPSRTCTRWWHNYAMKAEIRLIKGRLKFSASTTPAPFPSAIIVFRPPEFKVTEFTANKEPSGD